MTRHEFVHALKMQTSEAAVSGTKKCLERPPGRKPAQRDVKLSNWYRGLSNSDRESVEQAIREAAELAIFSALCVLDGVSAIESGTEKGELKLYHVKHGRRTLLNDDAEEYLHDIYNDFCRRADATTENQSERHSYQTGTQAEFRTMQTGKDGMDLHVVSTESAEREPNAPAISLPKNEHRKLPSR
jgi:hypothetical protein